MKYPITQDVSSTRLFSLGGVRVAAVDALRAREVY